MQMRTRSLLTRVLACAGAMLAPIGGYTSGSTQVSQVGQYYRITFETPSISFATRRHREPVEMNYHDRARKDFEQILADETYIERNVAKLHSELEKTVPLAPWSASQPELWGLDRGAPKPPFRMNFNVSYPRAGRLQLSFAKVPTEKQLDGIKARIQELFSLVAMSPSMTGQYYRFILPITAHTQYDPQSGAITDPLLSQSKALIEKQVGVLMKEFGQSLPIIPFDEKSPDLTRWDIQPGHASTNGPCRMGMTVDLPLKYSVLELSFGRSPTELEYVMISKRASELFPAKEEAW